MSVQGHEKRGRGGVFGPGVEESEKGERAGGGEEIKRGTVLHRQDT